MKNKPLELPIGHASRETLLRDLMYSELSPRLVHFLTRQGMQTAGDLLDGVHLLGSQRYGRKMRNETSEFIQRFTIEERRRK